MTYFLTSLALALLILLPIILWEMRRTERENRRIQQALLDYAQRAHDSHHELATIMASLRREGFVHDVSSPEDLSENSFVIDREYELQTYLQRQGAARSLEEKERFFDLSADQVGTKRES